MFKVFLILNLITYICNQIKFNSIIFKHLNELNVFFNSFLKISYVNSSGKFIRTISNHITIPIRKYLNLSQLQPLFY